jgi:uncharacterized protein YdbL (DUF1318 family)
MAKSRRRSIYPILLIVLVNGLVFAGSVVPLSYYGFEPGPPVDVAAAGWAGWVTLVMSVVGLAVLILGGVLLRAVPKIPAFLLGLLPTVVAGIGLIGAQLGAGNTLDAITGGDPGQTARIAGVGISEALNASVIGSYVASALMMGSALTISLRHWPSRSSLSSGGKIGLMGGAFLLLGMIVGSLFWAPLGGLGMLPWVTSFVGLVSIAIAAHAIRNDPTDAANVQAAGELWVTMLLSIGALVLVATARHTSALMEGLATFATTTGHPDPSNMVQAWTAAEPALYASALYAVPLLFAAITSMLSRESLGSWGLRNAAASILILPVFFMAPAALQHVQTAWAANQVAKTLSCSPPLLKNADLSLPITTSSSNPSCPALALEVGRSEIRIGETKIGATSELDYHAGCARIAAQIETAKDKHQGDVAVDDSLSFRRAACLADALAKTAPFQAKAELYRQMNPDGSAGRTGGVIPWVMKGNTTAVGKARPPFDQMGTMLLQVTTFGPSAEGWDPNLVQLHLFEGGWELKRGPTANKTRFEGPPEEGLKKLGSALGSNMAAQVVVISADRSVRMGHLLQYASAFRAPQLVMPPGMGPKEPVEADGGAPDAGDAGDAEAGDTEAGGDAVAPPGSGEPAGSAAPPASVAPAASSAKP